MPQESDNPSVRMSPRSYLALDALKEAGMTTFDGVIKALLSDFSAELFEDIALDRAPTEYKRHALRAWAAFMVRQEKKLPPPETSIEASARKLRKLTEASR